MADKRQEKIIEMTDQIQKFKGITNTNKILKQKILELSNSEKEIKKKLTNYEKDI